MRSTPTRARSRGGRSVPPPRRTLRRLGLGGLLLLCGCGTVEYVARPVDPVELLRELRTMDGADPLEVTAKDPAHPPSEPTAVLTMEQAAALAVTRNPGLRAMRAEIGVARARLVEAGLLPDPSVGWDAMDVLASQWVNGDTEREGFVAGFGLSWRVPRPGEFPALEARAEAELERTEWAVARAEWNLAQDVANAWIDLVSVRKRLDVANELLVLGRRTASVLARARGVRAVTGIEANLAAIDVAGLELERLRLEDEEVEARQRLNTLIGLVPSAEYPLAPATSVFDGEFPEPPDPEAVVDVAVRQRPDLAGLMARYEMSEAGLRLEVARQFPEFSIGTGVEITLPLLSRWNRPAINRAYAQREVLHRTVTAEVARLRAEVHQVVTAYRKARRQADYLAKHVEPRLAESLRLTQISLKARELSTIQVLLTQRQILDVRMRTLTARQEAASSWMRVRAVSGRLFQIGVRHEPDAPDDKDTTP